MTGKFQIAAKFNASWKSPSLVAPSPINAIAISLVLLIFFWSFSLYCLRNVYCFRAYFSFFKLTSGISCKNCHEALLKRPFCTNTLPHGCVEFAWQRARVRWKELMPKFSKKNFEFFQDVFVKTFPLVLG